MYLQRQYDPATPGKVTGVVVLRAKRRQHFSPNLVEGGLLEGWLSISNGVLTISNVGGAPVRYRIVRTPGAYCCHCDAAVGDVVTQSPGPDGLTEGQRHIQTVHGGAPSPDPLHPAGYRIEAHYTGLLLGPEVEAMTREEASALDRQVRDALAVKLRVKYGNTQGAAVAQRAAKQEG